MSYEHSHKLLKIVAGTDKAVSFVDRHTAAREVIETVKADYANGESYSVMPFCDVFLNVALNAYEKPFLRRKIIEGVHELVRAPISEIERIAGVREKMKGDPLVWAFNFTEERKLMISHLPDPDLVLHALMTLGEDKAENIDVREEAIFRTSLCGMEFRKVRKYPTMDNIRDRITAIANDKSETQRLRFHAKSFGLDF